MTYIGPDLRLSRRAFLRSAALGASGLIGAYLLGCGNDGSSDLNDLWELRLTPA